MVFAMVQEPAKLGLAAAPGVTGVAFAIPVKNQIAAFRLVNPRGVRIGVIYKDENAGRQVEEAVKAAEPPARRPHPEGGGLRARDPGRVARAAGRGPGHRRAVDPDRPRAAGRRDAPLPALARCSRRARPSTAPPPALVAEGALVSNGPDLVSIGEQVGELVNRLAAGDRARIEMLVPRAELVINRKIAGRLKIDVPADVLKAAKQGVLAR